MHKKTDKKFLYGGVAALVAVVVVVGVLAGSSEQFQGFLRLRDTSTITKIEKKVVAPSKLSVTEIDKISDVVEIPAGVVLSPTYGNIPTTPDLSLDTRSRFVAAVGSKYRTLKGISLTAAQWNTYKGCFTDMIGHVHEMDVCYMKSLGFVQAYPDGLFKPNNAVNRAEAAKMFVAVLLGNKMHSLALTKQLYGDVALNDWYAAYVNTLAQNMQVDIKPYPSLSAPELSKSNFFPSYAMSVARSSNWLNMF